MPDHNLKKNQLSNLEAVFETVKDFSKDAGVGFSYPCLDEETVVLESGHQPNFLPHSGFLKKLFLLDSFRKKFHKQGKEAIALFGFADYNLCTSRLLTQNKLPAFNRLGYEKVGFKISGENIWKRFDYLSKPCEKDWKKEMEKIAVHYKKYSIYQKTEPDLTELMEILYECYVHAKNFPDLNAFFISRVCNNLLDLNISFFRYSDLQRKNVFLEEWKSIILNLKEYNSIYNDTKNPDAPLCAPDSLPFWYHCPCGAKINLLLRERYAVGTCRLCSGEHVIDLNELDKRFPDMSPNAVSRNVIFSEGMGTHVFISGSGGGLVYGRISDEISRKLGFNLPVTVSWKSRDNYRGPAHVAAIGELVRICDVAEKNARNEDLDRIIKFKKARLKEMAANAREKGEKEEVKKYQGQYVNLMSSISIIKAVHSTVPSFIDIFVSHGIKHIAQCWGDALENIGEEQIIVKDVVYCGEDIYNIFRKLEEICD